MNHPPGLSVNSVTRFTDPAAVEAWDAWFRWREGDELRDITIDATWWRVGNALAAVEGPLCRLWAHRYAEAFGRWRLLPDERLLRQAGTTSGVGELEAPVAVLNVAAFILGARTPLARFDRTVFVETAALAVRMLDDALSASGKVSSSGLRIGVIGMANAFALLGLDYASSGARDMARTVAMALAEGCLHGNIELATERGANASADEACARWYARGMPIWLIDKGRKAGLRHVVCSAISPQPRLARLADNMADALDPLTLAESVKQGFRDAVLADAPNLLEAQRELRAAMQPWIDLPINYPPTGDIGPDGSAPTKAQARAISSTSIKALS
jgi:ribonucleoside-diphosphate reductase alpha chain